MARQRIPVGFGREIERIFAGERPSPPEAGDLFITQSLPIMSFGAVGPGPWGVHAPRHTPTDLKYGNEDHTAASVDELLSLIDGSFGSLASGEIIEYTGGDASIAADATWLGGDETWPLNVVVRPPFQERALLSGAQLLQNAACVCMYGFDFERGMGFRGDDDGDISQLAYRSKFWRCLAINDSSRFSQDAVALTEFVECAMLRWYVNAHDDRSLCRAMGDSDNFWSLKNGCWIPGACMGVDPRAASGTELGRIVHPTLVNASGVLATSYTITGSEVSADKGLKFMLGAIRDSEGFEGSLQLRRNGTLVPGAIVTLPGVGAYPAAKQDYGFATFTSVTLSPGDVIEVVVTRTAGSGYVEVFFGSARSTEHVDTEQIYRGQSGSNAGKVINPTYTNGYHGGSQNAALMVEQIQGQLTVHNMFLGVDRGSIGNQQPFNTKEDQNYKVHFSRVHSDASLKITVPQMGAVVNCRTGGVTWANSLGGATTPPDYVHPSNVFNSDAPLPEIPDLSVTWAPNCPSDRVLSY